MERPERCIILNVSGMCGRFSNKLTEEKLEAYMAKVKLKYALQPNYNIAPSHSAYVVKQSNPNEISEMSWGIFPYGKTTGNLLINARSETIFEKPTFKYAIRNRRCLVLGDSFYEWKKSGKDRIPYRISWKDDGMMVFAGLYNEWINNGNQFSGFVILTSAPNLEMSTVHNRAPVLLKTEEEQLSWISDISYSKIQELTQPLPDELLHIYRVSQAVNKPINNSLDLHREIPEQPTLF